MYIRSRFAIGLIALSVPLVAGIAGYMILEDWTLLEATYMTVVTMTTVGFSEVRPLSSGGRIFTIFLMVGGVGVMLYILTNVVQTIVQEEVFRSFVRRRRMKTTMARLSNHFILCGLGRVGMEVAQHFVAESVKFIVVDPRSQAIARAEDSGYLYVQGDATRDETLLSAAVDRAHGLVAATGADSDNVFITLTARGLNAELDIVARASESETQAKLMRAGASRVVSPYSIGGRRMALSATRPLAVDLFDSIFTTPKDNEFRLAEVQVPEDSPLVGVTLDQTCAGIGIHALAVKRASGEVIIGPAGDAVIEPGDGLILVGDSSKLEPLEGKPKG